MKDESIGSWVDVEALLRTRPPGTLLKLPKAWVGHPRAYGMRDGFSLPTGQIADYSKRLDEATCLEVAAYRRHYVARLNISEPRGTMSSRGASGVSGAVIGAILGAALGRSEQALVTGAAVGGVLWATLRE